MKKMFHTFFPLLLILLICSCSSKPAIVIPPEWGYAKDAIQVSLKSDRQLNLYQGTPHTLLVCMYHLRDPNSFNQLVDEKEGLSKLLECGRFDPSVTNARRFVVQPDKELKESLDRPEGAKYVAVVAGYYFLHKDKAVRFFPIPVVEEKKGSTVTSKPGILKIDLYLGPQQIQEAGGK